jgi:signal transduction histidine kinase
MIQMHDSRWMNLTTYVAVGAMYVVGAIGLPNWGLRLAAAGLCLAFGVLHAWLFNRLNSERRATFYFALQAAVLVGLLALRSTVTGSFGFLFFILSIQAALILPARRAAGWALLFFALSSLADYTLRGSASLIGILFNMPVYFICLVFGQNLRDTELARQRNQQLLEELRATQNQLQDLAVAEERNRLAREMHDALGHRLTVAVVQLEGAQRLISADPDRAARMIGTMRDEMKEALAELRRTVAALRGPLEDAKGAPFEAVLTRLAQTFQDSTGLAVHLDLPDALPALPARHRLALYRAAQESLTNAQRHSAAQQVWLTVSAAQGHIMLTAADDGKGLGEPVETRDEGYGLRGLRERAAELGGELALETRPGGGAQVRFSLPTSGGEVKP